MLRHLILAEDELTEDVTGSRHIHLMSTCPSLKQADVATQAFALYSDTVKTSQKKSFYQKQLRDWVVLTVLAVRVAVLAGLMGGQRSNQGCPENTPRQTGVSCFYPHKDRCVKETDTGPEHTGCFLELQHRYCAGAPCSDGA